MKTIIKNIILENQFSDFPEFFHREIEATLNSGLIISLIGARRSGKTYIFYQLISELLEKGVKKEEILFLNFEDERLFFKQDNLDEIIQVYQEIYPETEFKNVYLFFDEIQNIPGWEKFIRRIYDTKTRHIYITGSNSKLLSTEIATELRGRTLSFTVFPLSFNEYLKFNQTEPRLYPQSQRSKIIHLAGKFMTDGGFPETLRMDAKNRIRLLQQYFNVMIFRDLVERYKISNPETLKFFIKKVFSGVTTAFSVNKAYRDIKSLGYAISNKFLYEYAEHCNTIFLTQAIPKFDFSEIKQEKSDKKVYVIDNGLLSAIEFTVSQNLGKLFENMVALEFIKAGKQLFYFKQYQECDFILKEENTYLPIQVAYSLEGYNTKEREIKGLYEACRYLKTDKGMLITFDTEEKFVYKEIEITVVPFYSHFLK